MLASESYSSTRSYLIARKRLAGRAGVVSTTWREMICGRVVRSPPKHCRKAFQKRERCYDGGVTVSVDPSPTLRRSFLVWERHQSTPGLDLRRSEATRVARPSRLGGGVCDGLSAAAVRRSFWRGTRRRRRVCCLVSSPLPLIVSPSSPAALACRKLVASHS